MAALIKPLGQPLSSRRHYPDEVFGRHTQYARKPARCQRITVSGVITANAVSVVGTSRDSQTNSRRSTLLRAGLRRLAPKHVDLVAKNQNFGFTPCAGPEQPNERAAKQSEKIDHRE